MDDRELDARLNQIEEGIHYLVNILEGENNKEEIETEKRTIKVKQNEE